MRRSWIVSLAVLIGIATSADSQIKRTSVPIGDAVDVALKKCV